MTKIALAITLLFLTGTLCAQQQGYVVMIDADNAQPFYVRMGDSVINSSDIGHLAIPHLKDSIYNMMIGFPGTAGAPYRFAVKVIDKDQGLQLQHVQGKSWTLYNWQTHEMYPALTDDSNRVVLERGVRQTDAFSELMAAVVNDSSVMYSVPEPPKPRPDTSLAVSTAPADSGNAAAGKTQPAPPTVMDSLNSKTAKKNLKPAIRKLSERPMRTSVRIAYLDASGPGHADTVILYIPYDKKTPPEADSAKITATHKREKGKKDTTASASAAPGKNVKNKILFADCKNEATDHESDSLQLRILIENTQESKIAAAKKMFAVRCFSVKQIRALAGLFSSDKAKYQFLETAYPYVSDRQNFGQLSSLLSDNNYVKQFQENFR